MPIRYSKLSNYRLKKLLMYFCEDLTAGQTAKVTGINRNTGNRYYHIFREKIAAYQESINMGSKVRSNLMRVTLVVKGKAGEEEGLRKYRYLVY